MNFSGKLDYLYKWSIYFTNRSKKLIRYISCFVLFFTIIIRYSAPSHPLIFFKLMASPRSLPVRSLAPPTRRYRRSAFNGAKQLDAAQAGNRRVLVLLGLLALGLLVAIAVIVGVHFQSSSEQAASSFPGAAATHPANH
jgi:hypothetical protein